MFSIRKLVAGKPGPGPWDFGAGIGGSGSHPPALRLPWVGVVRLGLFFGATRQTFFVGCMASVVVA